MMPFIVKTKGKKASKYAAHIWDEIRQDTVCHMWATGGIKTKKHFEVCEEPKGRRVCHMCSVNYAKIN